jgi:predicted HTH transcriptional regulator
MRVFKDVRLVEQLGSGVHRILRHYDKSIFKFSPNFLRVTFSIKNVGENVGENAFKLNNTQKQIILLIQSNKYITQLEMSEQLNKTVRTIQRNMRVLQENELIYRVGSDASGYWELRDLEPVTNVE